jgi:hypothetical protein
VRNKLALATNRKTNQNIFLKMLSGDQHVCAWPCMVRLTKASTGDPCDADTKHLAHAEFTPEVCFSEGGLTTSGFSVRGSLPCFALL